MSETSGTEVDLAGTPFDVKQSRGLYAVLGAVEESSADTWEGVQWRLTELEAKSRLLDSIEERFDAIISEIVSSHNSLSQQVGRLERALGIPSPQKSVGKEVTPTRFLLSSEQSSSWLRRETATSSSDIASSVSQSRERQTSYSHMGRSGEEGQEAAEPRPTSNTGQTILKEKPTLKSGEPAVIYGAPSFNGTAQAIADTLQEGLHSATSRVSQSRGDPPRDGSQLKDSKSNTTSNNSTVGESSEVLEAHMTRTLSPSVWNAAFFIGMNRTGWASSLTIFILLIINMTMQCTFLLIIRKITATEIFSPNELETLENWRLFVGQSVQYYDPLTKTALSQRICAAGDESSTLPVDLSDSKAQLVEDIRAYLPDGTDFLSQTVSGPSLTLIALTFWTLKVLAEMLDIWDTGVGVLSVPKGRRNIVLEGEDGTFRFASFRRKQKVLITITLIVRSTVCFLLWGLGCDFLLNYSIEPAELILNAVALEIVLNVDEVLYTLVPHSCKHLMSHLEPLPGPPSLKQWKGLDARSGFLTVLLIGSVFGYHAWGVEPLLERIRTAHSAMCGGTQNVIFATDPYQFVYSASLDASDASTSNVNSAARLGISELVNPDLIPLRNYTGYIGDWALGFPQTTGDPPSWLQQVAVMTNAEASTSMQEYEIGTSCSNGMVSQVHRFMQEYMKDYGVLEVEHCEDVRHKCFEVPAVRVICPRTCGCDEPFGDIFDIAADGGCPGKCLEVGRWMSEMQTQPCKDLTLEYLQTTDFWPLWVQQFEVLSEVVSEGYEEVKAAICEAYGGNCTRMFELGCDFVPIWNQNVIKFFDAKHAPNACTGRFFGTGLPIMWRPMAALCPETCGCIDDPDQTTYVVEDSTVNICPTSCYADTAGVGTNQSTGLTSPEADNTSNASNDSDV